MQTAARARRQHLRGLGNLAMVQIVVKPPTPAQSLRTRRQDAGNTGSSGQPLTPEVGGPQAAGVKVFLVRHSLAVQEHAGLVDAHRYLSEEGRKLMLAVGAKLAADGVTLDALLTSPLVRAVQTAELLARSIGFDDVVTTLPALSPGVPPEAAAEALAARGAAVAVVGHEPGISALGAVLVGRPAFPPLRPAQVSLVERGRAMWTLHPGTLELERLLVA